MRGSINNADKIFTLKMNMLQLSYCYNKYFITIIIIEPLTERVIDILQNCSFLALERIDALNLPYRISASLLMIFVSFAAMCRLDILRR